MRATFGSPLQLTYPIVNAVYAKVHPDFPTLLNPEYFETRWSQYNEDSHVGRIDYPNQDYETFVYDGHTGLEHSIPVPVLYDDVVNLFGRSGTGYTPTLIVGFGGLSGEYYWYQHNEVWQDEQLLQYTPREIIEINWRWV